MNTPQIIVGIPTYKRPERLRACLNSIANQRIENFGIKVFVADNDPDDQAGFRLVEEMAPTFPFHLWAEVVPEPGISAARDAILRAAAATGNDFIAMLDDDETASRTWLCHMLKTHRDTGAHAIGGPLYYLGTGPGEVMRSGAFDTVKWPNGFASNLVGTSNVFVDTHALWKVNWPGFDPAFGITGGEDAEWFARLQSFGFVFAWSAEAAVFEEIVPERQTAKWILRRAHRCGNTDIRVALKHRQVVKGATLLGKSAAALALSVPLLPLVLTDRRLWLLSKWWRAAGRTSALFGRHSAEYARKSCLP